jgi:hypothetical protein
MIAFQVALNGTQLCTAGVGDRGVLTVMLTFVGSRHELELEVGGLLDDASLGWPVPRLPQVGDEIVVRIVETAQADAPNKREPETRAAAEASERAYYEQLKRKYEPKAPDTKG